MLLIDLFLNADLVRMLTRGKCQAGRRLAYNPNFSSDLEPALVANTSDSAKSGSKKARRDHRDLADSIVFYK